MSKPILVIAGLTVLAIAAFLFPGERADSRVVTGIAPAAQSSEIAVSDPVELTTPVHAGSAAVPSARLAADRAPAAPSSIAGDKGLRVRFVDRLTNDSLGMFPVRVQRMSFPPAALERALQSRPNGLMHSASVRSDGEWVRPIPLGDSRTVQPMQDGLLELEPGLYQIGLPEEHLFRHEAHFVRHGHQSARLVVVGVAGLLRFRGMRSVKLTVSIVDRQGVPVEDLELRSSSGQLAVEDFEPRPPLKWTPLGGGQFVTHVAPGTIDLSGRSRSHNLRKTVDVRRGGAEQNAEVVAETFPFDGRLIVNVDFQWPAIGSRYEFALAVGRQTSPIPGTAWRELRQGASEFNQLRPQEYSVLVREVFASGRFLLTRLGSVHVLEGVLSRARFSLEERTDCVLFGAIEGGAVGLVGAFPLGAELSTGRICSAMVTDLGFTLRLPEAGTYLLGFAGGGSWLSCGTFTVRSGPVMEQTFSRPDGPLRVHFDGTGEVGRGDGQAAEVRIPVAFK